MSYDVSDLERFPISQEVMPFFFFFYPEQEFSFFDFSVDFSFAVSLGKR